MSEETKFTGTIRSLPWTGVFKMSYCSRDSLNYSPLIQHVSASYEHTEVSSVSIGTKVV